VRALVYVQSKDERGQIRPYLAKTVQNISMVNSGEELMGQLKGDRPFDIVILDDTFDAKTPDGESIFSGPSVMEILQEIQTGRTNNTDAVILTLLRPNQSHTEPGMTSFFTDMSSSDREQIYTELGSFLSLEKPINIQKLNQKLDELTDCVSNPPKWLFALKQVRKIFSEKQIDATRDLLNKLAEMGMEEQHIGFALLRARCLALSGIEHIPHAIDLLKSLEAKHPNSISIRMLLIENDLKLGKLKEAFEEQVGIFKTQRSTFNFERTLKMLKDIFERHRTLHPTSTQESEGLLLECAQLFINALLQDPPQYSRKLRPQILNTLAECIDKDSSWQKLVQLLIESKDAIEHSVHILQKALLRLKTQMDPETAETLKLLEDAHLLILETDPCQPQSLEIATLALIERGELETLDHTLQRAEKAGAQSLEFYLSLARYFFKIDNLKEASDTLHKAVRIQADDPRVLELRQEWNRLFESRNST
jgi:tetratricopeptide (TPR) repeat protein